MSTAALTILSTDQTETEPPLEFFCPGKPQTAGSKTAIPGKGPGGRPLVVESGNRAAKRTWRGDLRDAAGEAIRRHPAWWPTDKPLAVTFVVVRKRPSGHLRSGRWAGLVKDSCVGLRPVQRPDTSKLVRAAEDALTGVVWLDDAALVEQHAFKAYGDQVGQGVRDEGMFVRVSLMLTCAPRMRGV